MIKALVYGAGNNCEALLSNKDKLVDIEIVGIVDRNKAGDEIEGIKIFPIDSIADFEIDQIIITPKNNSAIVTDLEEKYSVKREDMICPGDINSKYILPYIKETKNVFLTIGKYGTCFEYVFRPLEEKGVVSFLRLLDAEENVCIGCGDEYKRLIIVLSDDVICFEKNNTISFIKEKFVGTEFFVWFCNPCDDIRFGIPELMHEYGGMAEVRKRFEYCYTYHKADAIRYGLYYYPQFFSDYKKEHFEKKPTSDVFFIGNAKKRLSMIHDAYKLFTKAGVTCAFYVFGVPEEDRISGEGIYYLSQYMDYEKTLELLSDCRCLLEICEEGDETSYRYAESVVLNKKIIVNDPDVRYKKYYNPQNVFIYRDVLDIDPEWIKGDLVDYGYEGDFETEYYFDKMIGALKS